MDAEATAALVGALLGALVAALGVLYAARQLKAAGRSEHDPDRGLAHGATSNANPKTVPSPGVEATVSSAPCAATRRRDR